MKYAWELYKETHDWLIYRNDIMYDYKLYNKITHETIEITLEDLIDMKEIFYEMIMDIEDICVRKDIRKEII